MKLITIMKMQDSKLFTGTINANFMYQDGVVKVININYRPNKPVKNKYQINAELYTTLPKFFSQARPRYSVHRPQRPGLYSYDPDYLAFIISDKFNHHGIWCHKFKSKLMLNTDIINITL